MIGFGQAGNKAADTVVAGILARSVFCCLCRISSCYIMALTRFAAVPSGMAFTSIA